MATWSMASPRPCVGVAVRFMAAMASAFAFQSMITSPRAGAVSSKPAAMLVSNVSRAILVVGFMMKRLAFMGLSRRFAALLGVCDNFLCWIREVPAEFRDFSGKC